MEEDNLKSIGNYEAIERLREVPEGVLYKAFDKSSEKPVLIKIYYPMLAWSEDMLDEFFNRISYLRFIEHDYLLPIIDVGKHDNTPYVVFPGDSDSLLHDRRSQMDNTATLLDFFYKIAEAIDFLHKQEVLHGNLNPENILIDQDGAPRLFDYGLNGIFKRLLAENIEDGFDNFSTANIHCAAPEQILGRTPTRQTDIFSFGLVLYFCILGAHLFSTRTVPEAAAQQIEATVIRVEQPKRKIPKRILNVVQKCVQPEPENRFKNFTEVATALERLKKNKWVRLNFKKRFNVTARGHVPQRMGVYFGLILIIGLLFAGYQYQRSTTATPPSGSSTEPNATQGLNATAIIQATQKPVSTPTAGVITDQSNPTPTIAAQAEPPARIFKPAFEGETPLLTDQAITIANLQNIREVARLGYGKPEDADISADGKYFAVASSAGVFIFSGTQLIRWIDPQDWATSVKFSNNVSLIAIGVQSGAIQLWDWQNEIQSATLTGHTGKITRIIFSRNDRLLYSASFDQHVRVWDLNQKTSIKDISAHSTRVNDIAVTSEGRILISCSDDQLIRIWDVASAKKVIEIKFDGKVKALAISPDDAYFAAGGESGFIYQRDLVDYQLRNNPIPVKKRIWNLQYENNNTLLAGVDNGETLLFSANEQTNRGFAGFEIKPPPSDLIDVYGASFDFDSYSVSYSGAIISLNWDGQVKAGPVQVLKPTYDNLDRLDFSKDGTLLASGGRRGTTNVWRLTNNAPLLKEAFIMPRGDPIAPDGSAMVVTIQDAYRLISLANGQRVRDFSEVVANSRVGYDRSGSIFISESLTESKTWDYVSGYETYFAGSTQGGCRMTKSANNGEILSVNSAAGALTIWDTWSNTLCAKIGQYRNTLSAVSADSKLLTYLAADGQLEGFDPVNNRVWKFKPNTTVTALAVSPDGSLVALGNADGKLSFINGRTGEKLWEITGNFGALQAIVFSEDGTKIATAGYDGTTRVFGIGITK